MRYYVLLMAPASNMVKGFILIKAIPQKEH